MNFLERYAVTHLFGTERGGQVLAFLESGIITAILALIRGDVTGFIAALPPETRAKIAAVSAPAPVLDASAR